MQTEAELSSKPDLGSSYRVGALPGVGQARRSPCRAHCPNEHQRMAVYIMLSSSSGLPASSATPSSIHPGRPPRPGGKSLRGKEAGRRRSRRHALAEVNDTWQVARLRLRTWVREASGELHRPWMTIVVGVPSSLVLESNLTDEQPLRGDRSGFRCLSPEPALGGSVSSGKA